MILFMVVATMLFSCQQEGNVSVSENEAASEALVRSLKFIPLDKRLSDLKVASADTRGSGKGGKNTSKEGDEVSAEDPFTIIICSWDWGRDSRQCKGFGLCNFVWFPEFKNEIVATNTSLPDASIIETDTNGERYTDILLSEKVSLDIQKKLPALVIDKSLSCQDTLDTGEIKTLTMRKGEYRFDPNLGENGGYRVKIYQE